MHTLSVCTPQLGPLEKCEKRKKRKKKYLCLQIMFNVLYSGRVD